MPPIDLILVDLDTAGWPFRDHAESGPGRSLDTTLRDLLRRQVARARDAGLDPYRLEIHFTATTHPDGSFRLDSAMRST